jgi:hypothetical protein
MTHSTAQHSTAKHLHQNLHQKQFQKLLTVFFVYSSAVLHMYFETPQIELIGNNFVLFVGLQTQGLLPQHDAQHSTKQHQDQARSTTQHNTAQQQPQKLLTVFFVYSSAVPRFRPTPVTSYFFMLANSAGGMKRQ